MSRIVLQSTYYNRQMENAVANQDNRRNASQYIGVIFLFLLDVFLEAWFFAVYRTDGHIRYITVPYSVSNLHLVDVPKIVIPTSETFGVVVIVVVGQSET